MPRPITKQHAEKIIKKLKAEVTTSRSAHHLAEFYYGGVLIASFGVRRASSKDTGHGFIPDALHISHHQTLELANCPLSYEQYVEILKAKGFIDEGQSTQIFPK
ncbi:MAG TPA: hypothetical protein VLQ45_19990 [Thermoanaerobaculia bacterium]|jgi:hypothetical protein|nr:hypothetical protein [Thermoanaerobaculia bacterium]